MHFQSRPPTFPPIHDTQIKALCYTGSLAFHVQSGTISPTFLNLTLAFSFHSNHASLALNGIPPNLIHSKLPVEPRTAPYI